MISIIIPTYNEAGIIQKTVKNILKLKNEIIFEIIVCDGQSEDDTPTLAAPFSRVISSKRGKGIQLNAGAREANYEILFFVHADMVLPKGTLLAIQKHIFEKNLDGGGFSNVFSDHNPKIKRLGRILNFRFNNREFPENTSFYGDNGIFVKKDVFQKLGGFKEIPIMEDYDFSKRMTKGFRVQRIMEPKLILSPRRHLKAGFLKTRLQWIFIKKLYLWGWSPEWLSKWYFPVR